MVFVDADDKRVVTAAMAALKTAAAALAELNFRTDEVVDLVKRSLDNPEDTTEALLAQH